MASQVSVSTNGIRVNGRRVHEAALSDGDLVELGRTLIRFRQAVRTPMNSPGDLDSAQLRGYPRGSVRSLRWSCAISEDLERVARSDLSVLLEGETGTGKEVLARAIDEESRRRGAFVAVNCGALPQGLVESLLFGHKKGTFSGASGDEPGFARAAEGGTLFLDEVGDLPASSQAVLLRLLQEHEVVPLGDATGCLGRAGHRGDPPVVGCHDRGGRLPPRPARAAGAVHVRPPPTARACRRYRRARGGDLAPVGGERASSLSLSGRAARQLVEYGWPANVRELEQCLKVAALLAEGDRIERRRRRRPDRSVLRRAPRRRPSAPCPIRTLRCTVSSSPG